LCLRLPFICVKGYCSRQYWAYFYFSPSLTRCRLCCAVLLYLPCLQPVPLIYLTHGTSYNTQNGTRDTPHTRTTHTPTHTHAHTHTHATHSGAHGDVRACDSPARLLSLHRTAVRGRAAEARPVPFFVAEGGLERSRSLHFHSCWNSRFPNSFFHSKLSRRRAAEARASSALALACPF
jgi:hypothetical protein